MVFHRHYYPDTFLQEQGNLHHHRHGHLHLHHPKGPRQTDRLHRCLPVRHRSSKQQFPRTTSESCGSSILLRDGYQQSLCLDGLRNFQYRH